MGHNKTDWEGVFIALLFLFILGPLGLLLFFILYNGKKEELK